MIEWRSTATMTRRHLWHSGHYTVETRCNMDPASVHDLVDDDKPRCKNCLKVGHRCPRCGGHMLLESGANALSRRDSRTEICSPCGALEASEDLGGDPWVGKPYWRNI